VVADTTGKDAKPRRQSPNLPVIRSTHNAGKAAADALNVGGYYHSDREPRKRTSGSFGGILSRGRESVSVEFAVSGWARRIDHSRAWAERRRAGR
jgi:hypothetical protein